MNENLGLIGKKLGSTQIFEEDGAVRRVTAIQAGPCVVLGKRTPDKHGYSALQLGFGSRTDKHVSKPEAGFFAKLERPASRWVREIRVPQEVAASYEVGQEIKAADLFSAGQFVDVSGISKGKGFSGVMKRHNFKGARTKTHGTHEYKRHGGSIGQNMTPGRVFKGVRMPGQLGNEKVTVLSLRVARVLADDNIVLVEGGVPGAKHGLVTVRKAVKKKG